MLCESRDERLKLFKIWSRRFSNQTCVSQAWYENIARSRLAENVVSVDCADKRMSLATYSCFVFNYSTVKLDGQKVLRNQ